MSNTNNSEDEFSTVSMDQNGVPPKVIIEKDNQQQNVQNQEHRNTVVALAQELSLQTVILTAKNAILYWRRWKSTLVQLLAPLLIVLILYILIVIVEKGQQPEQYVTPKEVPYQSQLTRCKPKFTKSCVTIRYSVNGDLFASSVMERVLRTQVHIPASEIVEHTSGTEMLAEVNRIPNATLYAIDFNGDQSYYQTTLSFLPARENTTATRYIVYINATASDMEHETIALQTLIDNSIASLRLGLANDSEVFSPLIQGLPKPEDQTNGQVSVFSYSGPQFFCICSMIILIMSMYSLVIEKESKLRFGMKMMGLRDTAFYISWFITFTAICFISTLVTVFSGMAFQIVMFLDTNWFILFAMFFTFGMCLVCLAFLLSTLVNTGKSALILGFVILAVSFILNMFVANSTAVYRLYGPSISRAVPILLSFYPPFNFAKIFCDISYLTLPQYNKYEQKYVPGPGYKWSDLYKSNKYSDATAPPTANSFYILLGLSGGFLIIAWYLDNVLPGATGIARKPWFFLTPSFYGIKWGTNSSLNASKLSKWSREHVTKLNVDDPIRREYENVRNPNINYALRLVGLKKTYDKWFGLKKAHKALKGLDLGVLPGTCVGYLGVNGAGKSTTMNILTGLISCSGGDALIFGKSVNTSMDLIRKRIGVCPQHDILWDNLTAKEHLLIFGLFKGVPLKKLNPIIDYLLGKVSLLKVKNRPAGTFSGGMKRRLSVCIACIGDPELILLDEPTTGMDPFSRRQVWDLIQEMKGGNKELSVSGDKSQQRVVLLTTHAMDEAEALCDRISIMADGELQAIGDGLSLKKQFGDGYTLTLVSKPGREEEVSQLAKTQLPSSARSVSENAGSFIYQIPKENVQELGTLLENLEEESEKENTALKDWGIAHTTLEQVYLVVNAMADEKRERRKNATTNDVELEDTSVATTVPEIAIHPSSPNQ